MATETRTLLPVDLKPVLTLEAFKALGGMKGIVRARSIKPREVIDE